MRSIGLYLCTYAYCSAAILFALAQTLLVTLGWIAGIALSVVLLTLRERRKCALLALCCVSVLVAYLRVGSMPSELPSAFAALLDTPTTIRGTVVSLPDVRETALRLTVRVEESGQNAKIIASVPLYPPVHVGDMVHVSGTLKLPQPFSTDGGRTFAYDDFLRKDGVLAIMQPAHADVVGKSAGPWLSFLRVLEYGKERMNEMLGMALPQPESALAVGILVGGKQGLGKEVLGAFEDAGMLQIVVLSGYNVMVVANMLMRVLSRLPRRAAFACASGSIVCFVLIAGAGSAALRAGLMALLALAAHTFRRRYDVLRAVAASLLVLAIWNPLMLVYDPGFQFSFIATMGLVLLTPVMLPRMAFLRSPLLAELVATTLCAELALLPFLLWQTGNLSLVSIAANVAAMPAIPFAMAASVAAGFLAIPLQYLHPMLPLLAGIPAYLPLTYVIHIAQLSASLPYSHAVLPTFPFWVVAIAYGSLALVWYGATTPLRQGSGARPLPSSRSEGMHPRAEPSLLAHSPPYTRVPIGR